MKNFRSVLGTRLTKYQHEKVTLQNESQHSIWSPNHQTQDEIFLSTGDHWVGEAKNYRMMVSLANGIPVLYTLLQLYEPNVHWTVTLILYSGKLLSGPNFVLFVLSLPEQKLNTWNMRYDGHVFLCKMDRMKIKHTNQLEIAQNEIWTPWKISLCGT